MKFGKLVFRFILLAALAYFTYLLLLITLQYIPFRVDVAFLKIKTDEVKLPYYLPFFKLHIYTSIFLLLAGFTQFSNVIRQKYRQLHRGMGWVYVVIILLAAAPSGIVMGWHANGGWTSQSSFVILGILWFVFTSLALYFAIKKNWKQHREFMIRSFALTLSAITLRFWKWVIVALFHPPPMDVYRIVAWLGWVLNLLIAEWIIRQKKARRSSNRRALKYE